jgi:predicted ATPase/class 3 adenylate cyclase
MSEIRNWLESIGLHQYADAFEANEIGMDLLAQVDDQMLKDIGVSIGGHRLRIRNAIAKSAITPVAEVNLSSTAPPNETTAASAERRQLTVMFCDLVGSTALSARLDPEDLRGIISAYHHCCTELVGHNGGFVAKYMGDGVLAYFGYPQAHEHDAERAVRTGLAAVDAVPKLATNVGSSLQVRVGIATGLVVVGDLIGTGAAREQAVVGETPNLAARLQALAEPGTVVIAGSTRRLTGGLFDYQDLGAIALKGFAENVPAWQVLGASVAESRFEALRAATTPLVGREEEIEILQRRWEQAKRGDGQVVLISGEPGIGKSRITQTVLERINAEPHTRLRYFCSPHHQDSALYPSIAQLERAAGLRRDDTDEQRLNKLEKLLARGTNDLGEAVPLLAELLSIPTGGRYPPLNFTPQKHKEKTLLAQLAQLEGLARRQPVLMVFEDVHWSDPTTRESLDLLIDRIPTLRVLLIITFRPEFTPPWIGLPHVTNLNLNRLSKRQRAEMMSHVGGGKALPKEIADQIVDRTDGVPLFIEELTKAVVESGVLTETDEGYTVAGPVGPLAIPTTLHGSLLARLDRLAPTREVAQIGAALGRAFSHELISSVATMPKPQLDDALAQLIDAELIFRRGTPPDAEYTFKHALVQDAAYSTLLRSRRQQLHGRIAATMETHFSEFIQTQPEVLARHCAEAGLTEKAVGYWLKAGQLAMARSAMLEAEAQLSKGLNLLAGMPEGSERQQRELDFRSALTVTLMQTQGYAAPAVSETLSRARQLCEQLNRPPQFANVLYAQCGYRILRGELLLACQDAKEHLELGEARNDPVVKSTACFNSAAAWFLRGEFAEARAYAERVLELYDTAHSSLYATVSAQDPQLGALSRLSCALCSLGYLDQARVRRNEALEKARQRAHAHSLAFTLATVWEHDASVQLEPALLLESAKELQAHCARHGFPYFAAIATAYSGAALSASGQEDEGLAMLAEGLAAYRATGALVAVPSILRSLAECHRRAGQPREGMMCLDEAARYSEAMHIRSNKAEIYRLRGELLIAVGDPVSAEASFRQAIAVAHSQSAKLWELRAAVSLAQFLRDRGKRGEARDLLVPIYGWFREGFGTPVLQIAKALLDELA